MLWRILPLLAALGFPLLAADLVRLPPPPVDTAAVRDSIARADSLRAKAFADTSGDTVTYTAPRIRFRGDRFSLAGGALLKYKASTLRADSIIYYSEDDVVDAFGAPVIEDPTNPSIQGYRMRYNLKNKVGTLYYGSSEKDGQTFNGIEVRRQPDSDIYIARGDLSTCDEKPDQHYYFYARRMIVEPDSKVLSGPIVMNIAEVPLAVLPMMVMPLGKGRRSGILQPKFGGDQSQGYYLQGLGYYWALSDYHDFQLRSDIVEGTRGTFDQTNLDGLYQWNKRYVWSGTLGAKLYLPEFNPSNAGGYVDFSNDLNLTPDGRQTLKGNGRIQSSANIVQDNALNEEQALEQTANAKLGYNGVFDWNNSAVSATVAQDYNLTQGQINRTLPDLTFRAQGPLVPISEEEADAPVDGKEPWYRSWTWNYNNRFNVNQIIKPALGATRGDSNTYIGYADQASLSGKYTAFNYFNLTPSLNASQIWSAGEATGDTAHPYRSAFDPANGSAGQYFAAWNASIKADTRIYGITQTDDPWLFGITAARHTISPSVAFTYAPEIDTNKRFYANPAMGGTAYQTEQQSVTFALDNDIDLKRQPGDTTVKKALTQKLFTSSSSLSYNFASDYRPWSDIPSNFNLYLVPNIPLTLTTLHRVYDNFADSSRLGTATTPILENWSFALRKGYEVGGGFNTGMRLRDTHGLPTGLFEQSPWSASLSYGVQMGGSRVGTTGGTAVSRFFGPVPFLGGSEVFQSAITHQASAGLRINPTKNWKMSYDTDYNFTEGEFSRHSFAFERTLHCWQMNFTWTPTGVSEGWYFVIRIIDLPDIKLETRDSKSLR